MAESLFILGQTPTYKAFNGTACARNSSNSQSFDLDQTLTYDRPRVLGWYQFWLDNGRLMFDWYS